MGKVFKGYDKKELGARSKQSERPRKDVEIRIPTIGIKVRRASDTRRS